MSVSKNFLDVKVTIWARMYFEDTFDMHKIADFLKKEKNANSDDVLEEFSEYFLEQEFLTDTSEEMSVEENGGNSTIEVYTDDGHESLYTNERLTEDSNDIELKNI